MTPLIQEYTGTGGKYRRRRINTHAQKFGIPTWYNDVQFRSKLEASWAYWFDTNDIKWEYEPTTFVSGAVRYTPDFRIGNQGAYCEIKPGPLFELNKHFGLASENHPFFLVLGTTKSHEVFQFDGYTKIAFFESLQRALESLA